MTDKIVMTIKGCSGFLVTLLAHEVNKVCPFCNKPYKDHEKVTTISDGT